MPGKVRPRGRRGLLRGLGLATVLATTASGSAAAGASAAEAGPVPAPAFSTVAAASTMTDVLVAGPDGAMWSFERHYPGPHAVTRYDASGRLTSAPLPVDDVDGLSALTPLADGGMGVVVGARGGQNRASISLALADARGRQVRLTRLPREARLADAFAVAGDGSVWFLDTCGDLLYRWRPGERLTHTRLPAEGCSRSEDFSSTLLIGPDGSVWVDNGRQARIVRRDVRGRVRQWRYEGGTETYVPPTLVPDPRGGGVAFTDPPAWGTVSGLVTRSGQLVLSDASGMPAFGDGGTLWRTGRGALTTISPAGESTPVALLAPLDAIGVAVARDGTPWFTAGEFRTPPSTEEYYRDVVVGAVSSLVATSWPMPRPAEPQGVTQSATPPTPLVLGGDGALWTLAQGLVPSPSIVRVAPTGLGAPRRPVANVQRVLARSGRIVTLQLGCAADRGRFCRGAVRLSGAAPAVRFIAPGQSGAAVRLTLGDRAARTLRRRGALRASAVVRSSGAPTTRRSLVLRRG